jgi:uncharacterized protein (TIGR02118 family)
MSKLIVLYPPPADVPTFERRYQSEHAPMVTQKIPGLKKFLAAKVLGSNRCRRQWPLAEAKPQWPTPWRSRPVVRLLF